MRQGRCWRRRLGGDGACQHLSPEFGYGGGAGRPREAPSDDVYLHGRGVEGAFRRFRRLVKHFGGVQRNGWRGNRRCDRRPPSLLSEKLSQLVNPAVALHGGVLAWCGGNRRRDDHLIAVPAAPPRDCARYDPLEFLRKGYM